MVIQKKLNKGARCSAGFTLIEILIVTSLMAMVSLTLFNSLSNGLRVWERSRRLIIEEDIVIFFDKISQDLRNSYPISTIDFEGAEYGFSFPTLVQALADTRSSEKNGSYVKQIGKVYYYYDFINDGLYKKEANYGQALKNQYKTERKLVSAIDRVRFKYYFLTDVGESIVDSVADVFPHGVEVIVEFTDSFGKRSMSKFIDIPLAF